ncbi:hypothetical protein T492DRAFT_1083336 [Pavlovales sp. CCMP2436]|nr:hypothetical protein T492DRAFT_1083336 [Pavlovales sp. CCMP2436]|mmetsp:Transcript_2040/g.5336  ORF Transcript_2040/g.5336 Transcript_2040/m.5336 type:complete len:400 (+) Transcript_2040:99-1298(+)
MDPFGDMFSKAAKLKSEQLKADRRKFEACPAFYKQSLYMEDELKLERQLPIDELLEAAHAIKDGGNARYARGEYGEAHHQYQRALGCVRYFQPTDPDWRKGGFKDETLREVSVHDQCDTLPRARWLHELLVSCYLNIAASCLARKCEYPEAIAACDEAIALDSSNAKAYFRRARCQYEPLSCGAVEQERALRDLARAAKLAPADPKIRAEYSRLKNLIRAQRETDRTTFDGMFERGPALYDPEEERKFEEGRRRELEEDQQRVGKVAMERVYGMIAEAEAQGNTALAKQLRIQVDEAREKAAAQRAAQLDWNNPTAEIVEDCKRSGIDLTDPNIRELFVQLKESAQQNGGKLPPDAAELSASPRAQRDQDWKRWLIAVSLAFIVLNVYPIITALGSSRR